MSALGFLGGLAGFASSFQKGYEQSEDREQLQKDREQVKKDREFQSQQREYEQGQQRRKIDEQKRADDLRIADAAVQTTETTSTPAEGTVYGNKAPVMRDDDGNLMPGAVETSPAQEVTKRREWESIYRDYAKNRKTAGDTAGAMEFETKAVKLEAERHSKSATALIGQANAMSLPEYAKAAAGIFSGDGSPFVIVGEPAVDAATGAITMQVKNNSNGRVMPATFKSKGDLTNALVSMFQPEAYAKRLEKQDEIAAEIAKNPYHNATPGTVAIDKRTGKPVYTNTTDRVQIGEDADGNPIYGKPSKYLRGVNQGGGGGDGDGDGTGTGGKKGKKTPLDVATSSVMDAIKESAESKTLNADQLIGVQATARELVANAARNNQQLDPYVAGRIALTSVLKPESVKPSYNPATGTFENTVSYNGNTFSVGKIDQAAMPDSQLKGVAQAFVSKLPAASKAELIKAAAGDKAVMDKINADITAAHGKQWLDQFAAANGRRPTQQDIQASIARTQAIVGQNIQLVGASGAVEQDKKQRDTAASNQAAAAAKAAIGTPQQIMALPPGKAAEIYRQYGGQTDAFQREALIRRMEQDRRGGMNVGGMRQQ